MFFPWDIRVRVWQHPQIAYTVQARLILAPTGADEEKLKNEKKIAIVLIILLTVVPLLTIATPAMAAKNLSINPPRFAKNRAPISGTVWAYYTLLNGATTGGLPGGKAVAPGTATLFWGGPLRFNKDMIGVPQNEETVAISPTTGAVVGGANEYRGLFGGGLSGFYVSTDGGLSVLKEGQIASLTLPTTALTSVSGGDPAIDVDNSGNFFYASLYYYFTGGQSCVGVTNAPAASIPTSSYPWGTPRAVACSTSSFFQDKEFLAVDRTAGTFAGNVYVTWTNFTSTGSRIYIARCDNALSVCTTGTAAPGGTGQFLVSGAATDTQFSYPAVGPNGKVWVVWSEYGATTQNLKLARLTPSSAAPWFSIDFTITVVSIPYSASISYLAANDFRIFTQPKLAVGFGGTYGAASSYRVWVVWEDCSKGKQMFGSFSCNNADVFMRTYNQAGTLIIGTVQVDGAPGGQQYMPWPAYDGAKSTLSIAFYDSQRDSFGHRYDISIAQSPNGGASFTQTIITSNLPPNEPDADPYLGGSFIGDYIQIAALSGVAYVHFNANYVQVSSSTMQGFQQDNFLLRWSY